MADDLWALKQELAGFLLSALADDAQGDVLRMEIVDRLSEVFEAQAAEKLEEIAAEFQSLRDELKAVHDEMKTTQAALGAQSDRSNEFVHAQASLRQSLQKVEIKLDKVPSGGLFRGKESRQASPELSREIEKLQEGNRAILKALTQKSSDSVKSDEKAKSQTSIGTGQSAAHEFRQMGAPTSVATGKAKRIDISLIVSIFTLILVLTSIGINIGNGVQRGTPEDEMTPADVQHENRGVSDPRNGGDSDVGGANLQTSNPILGAHIKDNLESDHLMDYSTISVDSEVRERVNNVLQRVASEKFLYRLDAGAEQLDSLSNLVCAFLAVDEVCTEEALANALVQNRLVPTEAGENRLIDTKAYAAYVQALSIRTVESEICGSKSSVHLQADGSIGINSIKIFKRVLSCVIKVREPYGSCWLVEKGGVGYEYCPPKIDEVRRETITKWFDQYVRWLEVNTLKFPDEV